jgi:aminoglycoside 3-N-acetyltransferase
MFKLTFRDLLISFRNLNLGQAPVIAHASLSAFGEVKGGADTMVGALLAVFNGVIMPTFTYKTMVTPKVGPPDNGITYGLSTESNQGAEFYHADMPADRLMGRIAETLRQHPEARRSRHPIYSFAGVGADFAIQSQTLANPFGPIQALTEAGGYVLLLGVDQTSNTSIHYAEQVAGRRQFIRWALTPQGILECPRWPGCSYGFNQATTALEPITQTARVGQAIVQAIALPGLVAVVGEILAADPLALLCNDPGCERCRAVRNSKAKS